MEKLKFYTLVAVAVLGFSALPVSAQDADSDENVEEVEEVIVTGSRIARGEFTGINPVTLITAEDIEASGQLNVSEVLRSTVQNTLGSAYEGFNSFSAADANISLRGAGSGRTLVLLDGKRMPGSPKQSGAGANIAVIPTAAVDRIEILTDGASAIYGGDAAAGVVNVILKKDYDGVTIKGGTTEPELPGGKEDNFSVVVGGSGEKSSFVFSYEHQERNTIYWKDREYTKSARTDSDDFADWIGISAGSRTWVNASTFQYLPWAACPGDSRFVRDGFIAYDGSYAGDAVCGYDYTAIGSDDASRKSDAISTSYRYTVSDDLEFSLRGTFSRVDGTSRFAPAVGSYFAPAGSIDIIAPTFVFAGGETWGPDANCLYDYSTQPSGSVSGLQNLDNTCASPVDGFGLIRFTDNGNREMDTVADLFDIVIGVDGTVGEWSYNASAQFSNQLTHEYGYNYINKYAYEKLSTSAGFDPTDPDTVNRYRQDTFERAENRYDNYFFGAGRDLGEDVSIYVGMEYFEFGYESRYDAGRNGFNVIGSAGNSSAGERDATAYFFETLYTGVDKMEISFSAREDDYSDFGRSTTWKLGASYDITPDLFVRASAGTSFIPPNMTSLYGAPSESYQFAIDYVACDAAGTPEDECKQRQYATYLVSNPVLEAEESDNFNFGAIWQVNDNITTSLDWYAIEFANLQGRLTLQSLINAERAGTLQANTQYPSGAFLNRNETGKLSSAIEQPSYSPIVNFGDSKYTIEGFDLKVAANYEVGPGVLSANLDYTQFAKIESSSGNSNIDNVGANGYPEFRYNLYVDYSWSDFSAGLTYYYIDGQAEDRDSNDKLIGSLDDVGYLDVRFKWDTGMNSTLSFGVRNVTEEGPVLDSSLEFDRGLYFMGHLGMVTYVNFTQRF